MIGNPVPLEVRAMSARARVTWAFIFALLAVTGVGLIILLGMAMRNDGRPRRKLSPRELRRRIALGLIVAGYILAGTSGLLWLALYGREPGFVVPTLAITFVMFLVVALLGAILYEDARAQEGSA